MAQADFLTQQNLNNFKALYPNDARLQSLTLSELLANTQDVTPGAMVQPPFVSLLVELPPPSTAAAAVSCVVAVGTVVIDAICLITGAVALRGAIVEAGAEVVGEAVAPIMSTLETIIAKIAASNATKLDIATGLCEILMAIKDASLFDAVWEAFKGALTWYYAALYGVVALATIVALFATEGLAIIAEVVLLLVACVFMVMDIGACVTSCTLTVQLLTASAPPAPPAPGNPYVTEPHGAFMTSGGYYLTFINGGGVANGQGALETNATAIGATEEFKLVPVDPTVYSFAIQVPSANNTFLSALNGGGVSTNDPPTAYPVQTYAKTIGSNETCALVQLPNGNYAICLPTGNYVTVSGGNLTAPLSGPIVGNPVPTPGAYETFTFKKVAAMT